MEAAPAHIGMSKLIKKWSSTVVCGSTINRINNYQSKKCKEVFMLRKYLIGLTLVVVTGGAFAQASTVTVDIGPAIVGLALSGALDAMLNDAAGDDPDAPNTSSTGFGIGVQYERQLTEQYSVGVRFAYLGLGVGMSVSNSYERFNVTEDFTAYAIEVHGRLYPSGRAFFWDGALGYANMTTSATGNYIERNYTGAIVRNESLSFDAPRHFFKIGAKLGWRVVFGEGEGFVLEPALGYDVALGGGDTMGKQMKKWADNHNASMTEQDAKELDDAMGILEQTIFVGGPRVSISFGYRF